MKKFRSLLKGLSTLVKLLLGGFATLIFAISTFELFLEGESLAAILCAALTLLCVRVVLWGVHDFRAGSAQTAPASPPPPQPVRLRYIDLECPGCGAPVTVTKGGSGRCEYCGRAVHDNAYN